MIVYLTSNVDKTIGNVCVTEANVFVSENRKTKRIAVGIVNCVGNSSCAPLWRTLEIVLVILCI